MDNFDFLDQICPKRVFPVKNRKSEHHQWISHIRISVGTRFQLKLKILFFGPKLPKKDNSNQIQKIEHHHCILLIQISLQSVTKILRLEPSTPCPPPPPNLSLVACLFDHSWPPMPGIGFSAFAKYWTRGKGGFWVSFSKSNIFLGLRFL